MTTATAPVTAVETEVLPDGRELRVLADGSLVVVGTAQARPHPVPGVDWIRRDLPRPRARRAHRPGPFHLRAVDPTTVDRGAWAFNRRVAHDRANALLISLLNPEQRAEYARTGYFWVEVPQGRLRFGRLYSIRFEPQGSDRVRILCVVPTRHHELPVPDIWANLLLVVRTDPDRFFAVAIDRTAEIGIHPPGARA